MIEELIESDDQRPLTLFWGVRHHSDLYASELIKHWQDQHDHFDFVPGPGRTGCRLARRTGLRPRRGPASPTRPVTV